MDSAYDSLNSLSLAELDALTSDDSSSSESSQQDLVGSAARCRRSAQLSLPDFAGFDGDVDMNDPITKQMQAILELRLSLHMDEDKEFMKEQGEKRIEREKMAKMSIEERIAYQDSKAKGILSSAMKNYSLDEIKKRRADRICATGDAGLHMSMSHEEKLKPTHTSIKGDGTSSETGTMSNDGKGSSEVEFGEMPALVAIQPQKKRGEKKKSSKSTKPSKIQKSKDDHSETKKDSAKSKRKKKKGKE